MKQYRVGYVHCKRCGKGMGKVYLPTGAARAEVQRKTEALCASCTETEFRARMAHGKEEGEHYDARDAFEMGRPMDREDC